MTFFGLLLLAWTAVALAIGVLFGRATRLPSGEPTDE